MQHATHTDARLLQHIASLSRYVARALLQEQS